MKVLAYGSILALAVSNALALSISCMLESARYGSCVPELKKVPNVADAESMKEFCKNLSSDGCKSFVEDAGISTTKCDINDENDKELASLIYTARIGYLAYCVTDSNGKTCPLSEYLFKQTSALQGNGSLTNPTQEELQIFLEDCKDEKCNKRLGDLIEVTKAYSKAQGKEAKEFPPEYDVILNNYKNKQCEDVLKAAGVNETSINQANEANASANAAKPEDKKSDASTIKTVSSALSLIVLIATLFM